MGDVIVNLVLAGICAFATVGNKDPGQQILFGAGVVVFLTLAACSVG
jgi:hypothetical protein